MVRVNERVRNWDCESGRVREWMRVWDSLRCSVQHVCFIYGYNFVSLYGSALFKFVSLQGRIMVNFVPNYSIQCLLRVCFLVFIQVLHTKWHINTHNGTHNDTHNDKQKTNIITHRLTYTHNDTETMTITYNDTYIESVKIIFM